MNVDSRFKNITAFARYSRVTLTQWFSNPEYFLFWFITTTLAVAYFETMSFWAWAAIAVFNLFVGILAVGSVVRIVDRAMMSLGLGFDQAGYGLPTWIVDGARPLAQKIIRIHAAGFAASDFEKYLDQISSRLSQPIETVRKPSASLPIIEFVIKHSRLPDVLDYGNLKLEDLRSGEFFVGLGSKELKSVALSSLPHMIVAGQTGSGKTTFVLQVIATILVRTPWAHTCLIDMKGGIDYQAFLGVSNFEMVSDHQGAKACLAAIERLYKVRQAYLLKKKLQRWDQLSMRELASDPSMKGHPIGPVMLVVDELAELSRVAKGARQGDQLQEQLATFARTCRYAGIHLILGTQRPEKRILDMQSKDNCPARVCFSVPSVAASTLVLGDMTATTLGAHPGRAVYQLGSNAILQTPFIKNLDLQERMDALQEKLTRNGYNRRIMSESFSPGHEGQEVPV